MLELKGVCRIYHPHRANSITALRDIDISFGPKELSAVAGPSGSGKSTLLNILGGLDGAYSGDLYYGGTKLNKTDRVAMADYRKDSVGFVFQQFHLVDYMSVFDNVVLALSMTKYGKEERAALAEEAIESVGLSDAAHQKASELSGGQKQRTAIARALVKNPQVLLADEPTGALDSETSDGIIQLLRSIANDGRIVIVITHEGGIANQADRLVRIKDGRIAEDSGGSRSDDGAAVRPAGGKRSSTFLESMRLSAFRIIKNKWRYLLVAFGGIAGLTGLALSLMFSQGIGSYVRDSRDKIADPRKLVVSKSGDYMTMNDYIYLRQAPGVEFVQKEHLLSARVEKGHELIGFEVRGLHKEDRRPFYAVPAPSRGRLPAEGERGIALAESVAKKLADEGESPSDLIGSMLPIGFLSPDLITNYPARRDKQELRVTGILEASFIGEDLSYVAYGLHEMIVRRSRFIGRNQEIPSSSYAVYVGEESLLAGLADRLADDYEVLTPEDKVKGLTTTFNLLKWGMMGTSVLVLAISSVMVGIILYISVLERRREIGILRALGGRREDIRRMFFSEGGIVGVFSGTAAILAGGVIYLALKNSCRESVFCRLLEMNAAVAAAVLAVGLAAHLISAIIPANRAGKLDPIELLRE